MRKKIVMMLVIALLECSTLCAKEKFKPFWIFKDGGYRENHAIPSGWMGDYDDLTYNQRHRKKPKHGENCIKIDYAAKGEQGWAGIYWQRYEKDWGTKPGYNLTGARKLVFYARGENGDEVIELAKVGGIHGFKYVDTVAKEMPAFKLTKKWRKYEIDLRGCDLSNVNGVFCIVMSRECNELGCLIYLDEIRFE